MTALGGIGHTLPFLVGQFNVAVAIAAIVVLAELGIITWVRHRYMETPVFSAAMQVALKLGRERMGRRNRGYGPSQGARQIEARPLAPVQRDETGL